VLFTSGHTQNVIAHHRVREAGVELLPKPYSFEELARRVREVLG
jgi:DNA-binding response OmpR family regulator